MPDLTTAKCTVGTDGYITVVTKTFMNQAQVAAVAGGLTSSVSTVTTGTDWVQVSTVLVPTSAVTQAAAETNSFVGSDLNPSTRGTVAA